MSRKQKKEIYRMKNLITNFCLILFSSAILSSCTDYGKEKNFNGTQLFYTSTITEAEANSLGNYLVKSDFADGREKTVQLNKSGNTYEFRVVVLKGFELDQEFRDSILKRFAAEISSNVFNGMQVDVHYCDEALNTLRVLSMSEKTGLQSQNFNGTELFYTSTITEAEANSLGNYLVKNRFADGNEKTVQLNKSGNTYEFKIVVKKGVELDQEFIEISKRFAAEISSNVFNGMQVDVHACDDALNTLVVPMYAN
jgi:hypothetical protein